MTRWIWGLTLLAVALTWSALAAEEKKQSAPAGPPARGGAATLRLIDLSFDLLGAAGASTAQEADLRAIRVSRGPSAKPQVLR